MIGVLLLLMQRFNVHAKLKVVVCSKRSNDLRIQDGNSGHSDCPESVVFLSRNRLGSSADHYAQVPQIITGIELYSGLNGDDASSAGFRFGNKGKRFVFIVAL